MTVVTTSNWPELFSRTFSLRRCLWVFFGVFALVVLYSAYYTYLILPRVYLAGALIEVQPREPDAVNNPAWFADEMDSIRSEEILQPVITDLSLDKTWAKREYKSGLEVLPPDEALHFMREHLKLNLAGAPNHILIAVASEVPLEAARIANAIADRYKLSRDIAVDQRTVLAEMRISDEISKQQSALETLPTPAQQSQQQKLLDELKTQLKETRDQSQFQKSPVRILHRADVPEKPYLPNNALDMMYSLHEGLFSGVVSAIVVEILVWYALKTAKYTGRADDAPVVSDTY